MTLHPWPLKTHPLFLADQENRDMAVDALAEAHTWEALDAALQRLEDYIGMPFEAPDPPVCVAGLALSR